MLKWANKSSYMWKDRNAFVWWPTPDAIYGNTITTVFSASAPGAAFSKLVHGIDMYASAPFVQFSKRYPKPLFSSSAPYSTFEVL